MEPISILWHETILFHEIFCFTKCLQWPIMQPSLSATRRFHVPQETVTKRRSPMVIDLLFYCDVVTLTPVVLNFHKKLEYIYFISWWCMWLIRPLLEPRNLVLVTGAEAPSLLPNFNVPVFDKDFESHLSCGQVTPWCYLSSPQIHLSWTHFRKYKSDVFLYERKGGPSCPCTGIYMCLYCIDIFLNKINNNTIIHSLFSMNNKN